METKTIRRLRRGSLVFFITSNNKLYVKTNPESTRVSQTFILRDRNIRSTKEVRALIVKVERGQIRDISSLFEHCHNITWTFTPRVL